MVTKLKEPNILSQTQLEYLEEKLRCKELWAKSENLKNFVLGVSTTSRIESMQSLLRRELNSNSRLCQVLEVFTEIEKIEIERFHQEFDRHKKNIIIIIIKGATLTWSFRPDPLDTRICIICFFFTMDLYIYKYHIYSTKIMNYLHYQLCILVSLAQAL